MLQLKTTFTKNNIKYDLLANELRIKVYINKGNSSCYGVSWILKMSKKVYKNSKNWLTVETYINFALHH